MAIATLAVMAPGCAPTEVVPTSTPTPGPVSAPTATPAPSLPGTRPPAGSGESSVDPELLGSWVATKGNPVGVIAEFKPDGTFTWSNRATRGTYSADGSSLTFMFAPDNSFCALGTLRWTYEISGDALTSDVLGLQCPGGPPLEGEPGSPDWIFQRQ